MVGEPCGRASTSKLLFYFLKLGADFSNCDRKKKQTKQKQLLILHLPLGCDL